MARPRKNTVNYFPHDCQWSKELEIFINKYGNEGYAFYYRLLELLGVTPDHKYDYSKSIDYQYLVGKTEVDEKKLEVYIKYLVSIGVIDEKLWKEKKIWVQSFVDSIAEVYRKRTTQLPTKDGSRPENGGFLCGNSQSKGKKRKLYNSKREDSNDPPHFDESSLLADLTKNYPAIDIDFSWQKYRNHCSKQDKRPRAGDFRLWVENDERQGWNTKKRVSLADIKMDTTGFYMGSCKKCGEKSSYNNNEIFQDSRCCKAEIIPLMVDKHDKKKSNS